MASKLTSEEKKEFKKQRKAEKKLASMLLVQQRRKDHLHRELLQGQNTWPALKVKWKDLLQKIKISEMQEDVLVLTGSLERWMDAKEFQLSLMLDEMDEFYEQYHFTSQQYVADMDKLFDVYLTRINDSCCEYNKKLEDKTTDWSNELSDITKRERETEENMKAMLFWMETNDQQSKELLYYDQFIKQDDIKSQLIETQENFCLKAAEKLTGVWSSLNNTFLVYRSTTQLRSRSYAQLDERDKQTRHSIRVIAQQTRKCYELIESSKVQLSNEFIPNELTQTIMDLRLEYCKLKTACDIIRGSLVQGTTLDRQQLTYLTLATEHCKQFLERRATKGERILRLYAMCRKYETEKEKVVSMIASYTPGAQSAVVEKKLTRAQANVNLPSAHQLLWQQPLGEGFWSKYSHVQVSMQGLTKCTCRLRKENEYLTGMLRACMSGA